MEKQTDTDIFEQLRTKVSDLVEKYGLNGDAIGVWARPLSPHEVIGNPEEDDFPLVKGRERMMDAVFRGAHGQAFTDMFGDWQGSVRDLIEMDLVNNFRRAVFVASLNAIMRGLGLAEKTVHCKDGDPRMCGLKCLEEFLSNRDPATVTMIGYHPRIFEQLRKKFMVYVVDLDPENVGSIVGGTKISGIEQTDKCVAKADILLVTGTTLVNGTIGKFLHIDKPTLFYGVTIAGAAELLGLERFCPLAM
ncbi:MAG: hypothetical protein GXP25_03555 [Planctomycetes bacterium]|nr:hypothetical protein [Planctomycetota bacterium]